MANLRTFLKLKTQFSELTFQAYLADKKGSIRTVK